MANRRSGLLSIEDAVLFLCDMQTGFGPLIKHFDKVVATSRRLLQATALLNVPAIVTEHAPEVWGPTVPELGIEEFGLQVISKTKFSMLVPEVEKRLKENNSKQVILCGVLTDCCVQQTALELLERDYQVFVVVDACSTRSFVDRKYGLKLMRDCGALLTTCESAVFSLLRNSENQSMFEEMLDLVVRDEATDADKWLLN